MSYIGLFELDKVDAKQNILTYGEDVPKYLVCFVCGDNLENNKTLLDANNNILTPTLTAIYSDVRDEYLVVQQLEWTLGMFNDCGIVNSTKLCGDFSNTHPICNYLGKDIELLGTRFDNSPDKKLKKIIDLGATYNLIHSKPLGEDTTTQLKKCLKEPDPTNAIHSEHIGGIPSWRTKHTRNDHFHQIGTSFDR